MRPEQLLRLARKQLSSRFRPEHPVDVSVAYRSSIDQRIRGGDVFHAIKRSNGLAAILIADVSTKGSLGVLHAESIRRAFIEATGGECNPARALSFLNEVRLDMPRHGFGVPFASAIVVAIDADAPYIRYASAGHEPAIVIEANGHQHLPPTGPILGVVREALFTERVIEFSSGDLLLLSTDGFTECRSYAAPAFQFGTTGIVNALGYDAHHSCRSAVEAVTRAADAFCGGHYREDATLAFISRRAR
jgi:sigma-B regulation protein RsbU (phosphoserine phosphatase)